MKVAVYGPKDEEDEKKPQVAYSIDVFIGKQQFEISAEEGKLVVRGQRYKLMIEPCFSNMVRIKEASRP